MEIMDNNLPMKILLMATAQFQAEIFSQLNKMIISILKRTRQ